MTKIKTSNSKLETQNNSKTLIKFLLILLTLIAYFIFVSLKYNVEQGLLITALSWSFFVLCTPVADAGFLIDFPLRLITNIRMFIIEIAVWIIAILINFYAFFLQPEIYDKTKMLTLFKHILSQPFPFWLIIVISGIGTFVSIQFGDEVFDNVSHKKKKELSQKHKRNYKYLVMIFIFVATFILYDFLLKKLGVELPI